MSILVRTQVLLTAQQVSRVEEIARARLGERTGFSKIVREMVDKELNGGFT